MASNVDTLIEMGFTRNSANRALAKTNYRSVQLAMDWLFAHSEDPDFDDPFDAPTGHVLGAASDTSAAGDQPGESAEKSKEDSEGTDTTPQQEGTDTTPQQALSLKCDDCGKLLRSEMDVQSHAARTGHANFSESTDEIKPLTDEEKKDQMLRVQEKMKQRRQVKDEQKKQEQVLREKARRSHGKEMVSIRQKQQDDEMRKIAEQRRKDKMDEKIAKQNVREQIEKDKRDRAAKFAKQSTSQASAQVPVPVAASPPAVEVPKKEYDQCRIQIRLTNGNALTQTFGAKEPLSAVRLYVQLNRTDGDTPFSLMTSFPRKVFAGDDMDKPLLELGLVPSAVLMVTKS